MKRKPTYLVYQVTFGRGGQGEKMLGITQDRKLAWQTAAKTFIPLVVFDKEDLADEALCKRFLRDAKRPDGYIEEEAAVYVEKVKYLK